MDPNSRERRDMERLGGEHEGQVSSVRQVAIASSIGTALEWYDYFLYGTAAALIFNQLFFPEADPLVGTLLAFATFGVGFGTRPIGGLVFGHFGDKIGRKAMLVITLIIMGAATSIIGLMPTYETIGIWAPILLVVLRLVQGFGVGGEWGGAVLMAVEYAPTGRRGFYGSWPQMGVPAGLVLATVVFALFEQLPEEQFLVWGWRVPFLLSIILVAVGLYIRLRLMESPAFREVEETHTESPMPILDVLRTYPKNVLLAMGARRRQHALLHLHRLRAHLRRRGTRVVGEPRPHRRLDRRLPRVLRHPVLRLALGPHRPQAGVYGGRSVLHPVRVPLLLAHEHRSEDPGLAGHRAVARNRARRDVRPPGELPLRALRHACPLQRGLDRLPAGADSRWRHRAVHCRRAARQHGQLLADSLVHDRDGLDNRHLGLPGLGDVLRRHHRGRREGAGARNGGVALSEQGGVVPGDPDQRRSSGTFLPGGRLRSCPLASGWAATATRRRVPTGG